MLAQRVAGLLPPLTEEEALASAAIASLAGRFHPQTWGVRPFRAPHHTSSTAALTGGGSDPRPGEISLAHHGVLFLDELPEWDRRVLDALREPLESGVIHISRAARQSTFPAQFQFVAAMNPCPCGWLGTRERALPLHAGSHRPLSRPRVRPAADRIDLGIEVPAMDAGGARRARESGATSRRSARSLTRTPARRRRVPGRGRSNGRARPTRASGRAKSKRIARRRRGRRAPRAGDGTPVAIGARVPPHPQGRALDRRPRRGARPSARRTSRKPSAIGASTGCKQLRSETSPAAATRIG